MGSEEKEIVFWMDSSDPAMQHAYQQAQRNFRYFWRELSWEARRIIPGVEVACVKTAFADRPLAECGPDDPVEQMWLNDVEFDGHTITATLLNNPNELESVSEGDSWSFPFEDLTDWMYSSFARAYGGYTVNLLRSRMSRAERKAHDEAWGLDFGDPDNILVMSPPEPPAKQGGFLKRLFGKAPSTAESTPALTGEEEHPMCLNMGDSFEEFLQQHPEEAHEIDERGCTMLHREALAGNAGVIRALLKFGADRSLRNNNGDTALDLAKIMRWKNCIALLSQ